MLIEPIAEVICGIKGERLTWFNTQGNLDIADHILVCEGRSSAHCKGIADHVELTLKKQDLFPESVEGHGTGEWVLMDYGTVLVHIFTPEKRAYYKLDELYAAYKYKVWAEDDEGHGDT